jgi:hypothetical protein
MNGNVFECYEEQTDRRQYGKTIEALDSYSKKHLKYSADLAALFGETMSEPIINMPEETEEGSGKTQELIYTEEVKEYVKRLREMKSNLATIHAVAWGQCSEAMRAKVKSLSHYKEKTELTDCVWLLRQIKAVTLQFDEKRNVLMSLIDARTSLMNCKQEPGQQPAEYGDTIRAWAETIEHHGGTIAENYKLIPDRDKDGNELSVEQRKQIARDRTLAIILIRGADRTKYGTLIADLTNQYVMGRDEYPLDLLSAQGVLVNYQSPVNDSRSMRTQGGNQVRPSPEASALTFAQRAALVVGTDGVTHVGITCWNCQAGGHYAGECPTSSASTVSGTTLLQYAYMLAQAGRTGIDPDWILLDSQSKMSVFCNSAMLTNIRNSGRVLRAFTNGGYQDSDMVGDFPNLGQVWYNKASIANILSLADVRKICRVRMDSSKDPALCVHRLDGSIMRFAEHPSGLYVYNTNENSESVGDYTMVSTVAAQKKLFSLREVRAADDARELYRKIGRPSEATFQRILQQNLIRNCPVTPDDARRAVLIYGPDIAAIKGKTTRTHAAPRAPTFEAVPIPAPILQHHRRITLCVDFFFVQGLPSLHTISRDIGFRTVRPVTDRSKQTILRELKAIMHIYRTRGLTICDVHADNEFECVRADLLPVAMNVVPADSHVGEVERSIRTIKEGLRTCVHGLPFKRLPRLLLHHMVADTVRCLNQFPWPNGISDTMSPACIVLGSPLPDFNRMRLEFGSYAQVFEDNDPTNTPRARSLGAIALNPTGNAQGDYFFLSLATGARISRHQWTALPMTDTAIARVEALALHDNQPLIQERGLVVEWRPDHPIDDSEYDTAYELPHDAPADVFDAADFAPVDEDELNDLIADAGAHDFLVEPPADRVAEADDGHWIFDNEQPAVVEFDEEHDFEEEEEDADDDDNDDDADNGADNDDDEGAHYHGGDDDEGAYDNDDDDEGAHEGVNDGGGDGGEDVPPYNLRERRPRPDNFNEAMDNPHNGKSYYPPSKGTHLKCNKNNEKLCLVNP